MLQLSRSGLEPDLEPNWEFGTVANTNPRVSGSGGGGPGRPSGKPHECTWIMAMVGRRSEGGCTSYIQILGANAFDYLLVSEKVIWAIILRVGDRIWLLGATMEGITNGQCDTPQALEVRAGGSGGGCGR